jgi:protein-S-isoprenylcysteine O-methyltransferase Ste14
MKKKRIVDFQKGITGLVILGLIAAYGQWTNTQAWLYLALHGTYGILWITKSAVFPDKRWEEKSSIFWAWYAFLGLSLYWIAPFTIVSGLGMALPPWAQAGCVASFGFGVFLHYGSDMQKYMALKLNPGVLLTDGLWSRVRNPNYLGELFIYGSFVLLSGHWAPAIVLAGFMAAEWIPNMRKKDKSLSRYPEFAEYKKRSWLFIPPIW